MRTGRDKSEGFGAGYGFIAPLLPLEEVTELEESVRAMGANSSTV
jgi:hypothetical protein